MGKHGSRSPKGALRHSKGQIENKPGTGKDVEAIHRPRGLTSGRRGRTASPGPQERERRHGQADAGLSRPGSAGSAQRHPRLVVAAHGRGDDRFFVRRMGDAGADPAGAPRVQGRAVQCPFVVSRGAPLRRPLPGHLSPRTDPGSLASLSHRTTALRTLHDSSPWATPGFASGSASARLQPP